MQIAPYLMFEGQCREAFTAYESILGGKIVAMMSFAEMPEDARPPGAVDPALIMHACIDLGGQMLMASDAPPGQGDGPQRSVFVSVTLPDIAETERVYAALGEGGRQLMPLAQTFWAPRFGMLVDRFGTHWMVSADAACLDR